MRHGKGRAIVQKLVGRLLWSHNAVLLAELKAREERVWYADGALARTVSQMSMAEADGRDEVVTDCDHLSLIKASGRQCGHRL